jgi:hypothetical protein
MRTAILGLSVVVAIAAASLGTASDVAAQATCRQKCTDTEQACLKRTGNKSQCGNAAQACLAKCR